MAEENPRPDNVDGLEAWLEERPEDNRALLKLAALYAREGRVHLAVDAYGRAGDLLCRDGLILRALDAYERALGLDRHRPRLMVKLAAANLAVGFRDKAVRSLKRAAEAALKVGDSALLIEALDHLCGLDAEAAARWIQANSAT